MVKLAGGNLMANSSADCVSISSMEAIKGQLILTQARVTM